MTYLERLAEELALPLYASMTDQEAYDELVIINKTQPRSYMRPGMVLDQQDDTEYLALTDTKKDRWLFFISGIPQVGVNPYSHAIIQIVKEIWGDSSQTIQNLADNRDEQVSRLSQLGIQNITVADITAARAL